MMPAVTASPTRSATPTNTPSRVSSSVRNTLEALTLPNQSQSV